MVEVAECAKGILEVVEKGALITSAQWLCRHLGRREVNCVLEGEDSEGEGGGEGFGRLGARQGTRGNRAALQARLPEQSFEGVKRLRRGIASAHEVATCWIQGS